MSDYLCRFLDRPKELHVDLRDPLQKAEEARRAMIDLRIAVVVSAHKPRRTPWE